MPSTTASTMASCFWRSRGLASASGAVPTTLRSALLSYAIRGFIRPHRLGGFNMKSEARRGTATCWVLTEFPLGNALATKDSCAVWSTRAEEVVGLFEQFPGLSKWSLCRG